MHGPGAAQRSLAGQVGLSPGAGEACGVLPLQRKWELAGVGREARKKRKGGRHLPTADPGFRSAFRLWLAPQRRCGIGPQVSAGAQAN